MTQSDFLQMFGVPPNSMSCKQQLLSALGGFLGIFGILMVSFWLLDPEVAILIIPSMGASAVLLFAAPNVPFSQPWNLLGGHAVSGIVGVACWQLIPDYTIAASASVGVAIGVMAFLRCIHPPGGATALAAVIGSEKLHALGYGYEFEPVMLNVITIFIIAVVFNAVFKGRQYPAFIPLSKKAKTLAAKQPPALDAIKHEDFVYALSQMDEFVDIDEADLLKLYKLATNRSV